MKSFNLRKQTYFNRKLFELNFPASSPNIKNKY